MTATSWPMRESTLESCDPTLPHPTIRIFIKERSFAAQSDGKASIHLFAPEGKGKRPNAPKIREKRAGTVDESGKHAILNR